MSKNRPYSHQQLYSILVLLFNVWYWNSDHPSTALALSQPSSPSNNSIMLKGAINIALSVDGFIADKHGGIDWLNNQPQVEGEDYGFGDFLKGIDVMIMGRNTFDTVVGFGKDMWGYGDLPIIVWTRNINSVAVPDWLKDKNIQVQSGTPKDVWENIQNQNPNYSSAYIDGGKTIQSFLKARLVHRLNLSSIPILLGDGIPLFGGGDGSTGETNHQTLKHISTKSFSNGFVCTVYDVVMDTNEISKS